MVLFKLLKKSTLVLSILTGIFLLSWTILSRPPEEQLLLDLPQVPLQEHLLEDLSVLRPFDKRQTRFRYHPNSAGPCDGPQLELVAVVHSAPAHFKHRRAIRRTWGSYPNTRTLFVVGRSSLPKIHQRVILEAAEEGDVILVEVPDSYSNLTLKHVSGLTWVREKCPDVRYVMKSDDDVLVDVRRVLDVLGKALEGQTDTIACRVVPEGSTPRRSGKWKVTLEDFPLANYPEYCSGLAYFLRPVTLKKLLGVIESGSVPYIWIDDLFVTGLAAGLAGIRRTDLGVWYAATEHDALKWMTDSSSRKLPWMLTEMTPRHWPQKAEGLWKKMTEVERNISTHPITLRL